jgi:hypothetical protein
VEELPMTQRLAFPQNGEQVSKRFIVVALSETKSELQRNLLLSEEFIWSQKCRRKANLK